MSQRNSSPTIRYLLGYCFLFLGLVSAFVPILQGWLFVALGLVLLKDEKWARKVHAWIHKHYPESRPFFKKAYKKIDAWLIKWWGI